MRRAWWFWLAAALMLLPRAGSAQLVVGRVLEAGSGTPVADVLVKLEYRPEPKAVTDGGGNFRLVLPRAGRFTVICKPPGFYAAFADVESAGTDTVEVVLRLRPRPGERLESAEGSRVEVIVLGGSEARPAPGLTVHAAGPGRRRAVTDAAGRARFRGLGPGRWTFSARNDSLGRAEAERLIPSRAVKLRLFLRLRRVDAAVDSSGAGE